tara:strand:+ start:3469 stop:4545 length:1077 start_codon:yes stop_codon:yes gene_type:complete
MHNTKTILTVTGIRPDFIRMSEVFRHLDAEPWCNHISIHTGQHYDKLLSDVFFEDLDIRRPDYNLSIGAPGKTHYEQQADLGPAIISLLGRNNIKPDIILFLGDSNSVLASVPLRKEGYRIGHIEAGMRSYDERMLEEINRKVCDHVSNLLFVYHENYKQKAMREGIPEDRIFVVGNTVIEPLRKIADLNYCGTKEHILLDIHRPENFKNKDRMHAIMDYANYCAQRTNKTVKMLRFGRTADAISEFKIPMGSVKFIDLMGYKDFVKFMQDSEFIISDSGTAQEEPALLKVPVIVPRDFTERPESNDNNCSYMLDLDNHMSFDDSFSWMKYSFFLSSSEWLGSGDSSSKIVSILKENL